MVWMDRELQSPQIVLNSDLNDNEKELIKLYINSAIKERIAPRRNRKYFDGIQTGIAQTLKMLDIWELAANEFPYHDELN